MGNKNLCIVFILIATIVAQATWVRAAGTAQMFTVGDDKGWTVGVDFEAWKCGKDFHFNDGLVFNYERGKHDITILRDQASFDNCCLDNPVFQTGCGWAEMFLGEGPNYYTSSIGDDCKNGMKLVVHAKGPRP